MLINNDKLFYYKAFCTRVVDGDTLICDIDLGFYTILKDQRIRLYDIDTPERHDPGFEEARTALARKLENQFFILRTRKSPERKDKYGRWLGDIIKEET
jgi:micrococcal nuclease